jgi:predicted metallo-beta-lactamase superfamily hydrolase
MKKKGIIILAVVVVVCALGFLASTLFNWNVDSDSASGNIGKSSRFSRKTATESITNMEELLQNDEDYKNSIVLAHTIMQTRVMQFSALVDMSNQVAADIPAFAEVLKDMNEAVPVISNVSEALVAACGDLSAALEGESRPDLAQNTINASMAYTTLQKQNSLANRFIATADEYLKDAEGSDRLKFVRDQWVDYQQMTAALEGDTKAAKELDNKESLLSSEKTLSAMNTFDVSYQLALISSSDLSNSFEVNNNLINALPEQVVNNLHMILADATTEVLQEVGGTQLNLLLPDTVHDLFRDVVSASLSSFSGNVLGGFQTTQEAMELRAVSGEQLSSFDHVELMSASPIKSLRNQTHEIALNNNQSFTINQYGNITSLETLQMNFGEAMNVMNFAGALDIISNTSRVINSMEVCNSLNNVITQTSLGNKETLIMSHSQGINN